MRPEAGTKIRILETRGQANIIPGDVIEVGYDPRPPDRQFDGCDWVQTPDYPSNNSHWGWAKWEPFEEERKTDPAPADPRGARLSRQRRELRRLNQQCRLVRLERDQAVAQLDLAMKALLQTREELAVCRLMKLSTS